jgi:hypothetical protein
MPEMRRRVPALGTALQCGCLFLWLVPAATMCAQGSEVPTRSSVVYEVTHPEAPGESDRYGEVISQFVRIALQEAGVRTIRGTFGVQSGPTPERQALAGRARDSGADYLLDGVYFEENGVVVVRLSLVDAARGTMVAETTRRKKVDLTFDKIVTEAVRELVDRAGDALNRHEIEAAATPEPRPRPVPLPAPAPTPEAAGEPAPAPEPSPAGVGTAATDANPAAEAGAALPLPSAGVADTPGPEAGRAPKDSEADGPFRRVELAAGSAPFLPLGAAADYFKIGLYSSVSGLLRFNLGVVHLGIGLEAGASLFEAQGASSSARTLLAPLAGLVVLGLSYGGPLEVSFRLSGGAALLSMSSEGVPQRLEKVLPYASGGIGLNFGFGPRFGLAVDTRFAVYFEQAYGGLSPLFGIAPTVYLVVRV